MLAPGGFHKVFLRLLPRELGNHFKDEIQTFYHVHSLIGAILSGHDVCDEFLIIFTDQGIALHPMANLLVDSFFFSNILRENHPVQALKCA